MFRLGITGLIGLGIFVASFSQSANYQLNNYSVGTPGTNTAQSSTYNLQGSVGEQTNGGAAGTSDTLYNGSIGTQQLNTPPAPTLSNGSNTYYNKLHFIVNTGGNPSDTTYALAVSTDNFATVTYVQVDGTLGSSPLYQTYTQWGGAGGSFMTDLKDSTTYAAKVAAMQGLYTNTAYGAAATASTVAPSLSFAVSPNTVNLGNLLPGNVVTSSTLSFSFTTNGESGGGVYVYGQRNGLHSAADNYTIAAYTGNLASVSEGFGFQVGSPSQTSGGPFSTLGPFNGTANTVGAETTVPQQILTTSSPIIGGTASGVVQAKASSLTPSSADYQEVLTFVASANF